MNKELMIFTNESFGKVRTVNYNDKPYFIANDIAKILGYASPKDAISRHCKGATFYSYPTDGGKQDVKIIPEGDIYRLIIKSKLPNAEEFESWVFDEILPTIRKTGGYVNNDDLFIHTYLPYADETIKQLFKTTLTTVRNQNQIIEKQKKEIKQKDDTIAHKEDVIIGLVDEISLAEKRQIVNRVVKKGHGNYKERYCELYKQFELKYHINLNARLKSYNETHKPKAKNKMDYIDRIMNKIPELYEIACKLYENDVKELVQEMYELNNTSVSA